jgi:flagella basal body P-ring formation protein FlgA
MLRALMLTVLCTLAAGTSAAPATQPVSEIERAVREFAREHLRATHDTDISLGALDPRLRLASCGQALRVSLPPGRTATATSSLAVRCLGPRPWTLYVGVQFTRYAEVTIATRPLARGEVIQDRDLSLERRPFNVARTDYFTRREEVIGRVATRAIGAHEAINAGNSKRARLVRRGALVVLALRGSAVEVRVKGIALEDGALGERVSVRNQSSARVVEGTVGADGVVTVGSGALL